MSIYELYLKELRQKNISMSEFEFYLANERKSLKPKKSDVAQKLDITLPTLTAKTNNPKKLTLENLIGLKELGINIEPILKTFKLL